MEELRERPVFGLVLAGGLSQRMGCDKAALRHADGRSLALRTLELLTDAGCSEAYLSMREGQKSPADLMEREDLRMLRDQAGEQIGPMAGVLAAMHHDPMVDWLVVSCDLPLLNRAALKLLIDAPRQPAAFVAFRGEADGLPEPLCAIYPANKRGVIADSRAAGKFGLRRILIDHDCLLIDPPPGVLTNTNTPGDWQKSMPSQS